VRRKTPEEYRAEFLEKLGDTHNLLTDYVNSEIKVTVQHKKCGYTWDIVPRNLYKKKSVCPKCNGGIKKTHQEFVDELEEKAPDVFKVIGTYINSTKKLTIKHIECNYEWDVSPASILNNLGCPNCSGKAPLTTDIYRERVKELVGDEYTILGEYIDAKTKIETRHNLCGHVYEVAPLKFQTGRRCPKCAHVLRADKKRKGHEQFVKEIEDMFGNEYIVLSKYHQAHKNVLVRHNVEWCMHEYEIAPTEILSGRKCPSCYGKKLDTETFKRRVYELVGDEYELLSEYINAHTKVSLFHKECGSVYSVTPNAFSNGNRCPNCVDYLNSRGVKKIIGFLDSKQIQYKREYKFDDCKYQKHLPFDFAIIEDDKIKCLIEFDGKQHFEPIESWGGEEAYIDVMVRDYTKNKYCRDNNIKLIRIPYFEEENIEKILEQKL